MRETREPLKRVKEEVRPGNPGPFANYTNTVLKGEQRTEPEGTRPPATRGGVRCSRRQEGSRQSKGMK